ncbi:MAG: efflux RND transporter periplasmic adaptor subunit [Methylococcaceae bacterium]|nr:efflux RND transporter periplasmic adaptor subunit [Methylococcaceae bacterium]
MVADSLAKLKIAKSTGDPSLPRTTKRRGGFLKYLGLLLIAAAATYAYVSFSARSVAVRVATVSLVYPSQAIALLNATGYVAPQIKADVASKAAGRLESLEVEEGMRVVKGQILARIEDRDLVASMNQALANWEVAKTNLKKAEAELRISTLTLHRTQSLLEKRFVSPQVLDVDMANYHKAVAGVNSAQAAIGAAEAAYRGAQVAVEYTLIRAPFDGVILKKNADVGDVLSPFSPASSSKGAVVSMADMNTLEVEADVSESSLLQVKPGQPCDIQLDAMPQIHMRGVVRHIVPTVDRSKATVMVKVGFIDKDSRILPDMSAKVSFLSRALTEAEQKPVTAVQPSALVNRDGGSRVFLVQGETVKSVPVETAGPLGDLLVVGKGLKPGDQVVLEPTESLQDGTSIHLAETK